MPSAGRTAHQSWFWPFAHLTDSEGPRTLGHNSSRTGQEIRGLGRRLGEGCRLLSWSQLGFLSILSLLLGTLAQAGRLVLETEENVPIFF